MLGDHPPSDEEGWNRFAAGLPHVRHLLEQGVDEELPFARVGILNECPGFLGRGKCADDIEVDAAEKRPVVANLRGANP